MFRIETKYLILVRIDPLKHFDPSGDILWIKKISNQSEISQQKKK